MTDTIKTYSVFAQAENEKEAARTKSLQAFRAWQTDPTNDQKKTDFMQADRNYSAVEKLYEEARGLLNQRVSKKMAAGS